MLLYNVLLGHTHIMAIGDSSLHNLSREYEQNSSRAGWHQLGNV